jgi:hypothetical protein
VLLSSLSFDESLTIRSIRVVLGFVSLGTMLSSFRMMMLERFCLRQTCSDPRRGLTLTSDSSVL